jgi:hypothetical protein
MISHKFLLPITPFAFTKNVPPPLVRARFYEVKYNVFKRDETHNFEKNPQKVNFE